MTTRCGREAIRSLVISHELLGTNDWLVIHHTDCGMELFDDQTMGELLAEDLSTATCTPAGWQNTQKKGGSPEGRYLRWLTLRSLEGSVREDVARIRNHPLVPHDIPVHGQIYDVRSGRLIDVH